jgi:hypothetical protein
MTIRNVAAERKTCKSGSEEELIYLICQKSLGRGKEKETIEQNRQDTTAASTFSPCQNTRPDPQFSYLSCMKTELSFDEIGLFYAGRHFTANRKKRGTSLEELLH